MTNDFFKLAKESQVALIKSAENKLGLVDAIIEKDIWICTLLEILFSMPCKMVFRGGTSLSKAYGLINRFSEDVDITIDYHHFRDPLDVDCMSRSQLKKVSVELKSAMCDYVHTHILPYIEEHLKEIFPANQLEITVNENGEQIKVYYPTVLSESLGYLKDHVLLEFGVRNEIEPQEKHIIKPYLSELVNNDMILPMPSIDTLSPVRTFWEKCTLIHVECHRNRLHHSPERLSRHWYDIYVLNQSWVGEKILESKNILEKVIKHKKAFFNASYANYEFCLQSKFRLIPEKDSLAGLESDYNRMCNSGMFLDNPSTFLAMIESLREFEARLNTLF